MTTNEGVTSILGVNIYTLLLRRVQGRYGPLLLVLTS